MARKETGYAWFVVFCSFALNFITDGVAYTFGIFFSEFLGEFKENTKASSAWVPSIMTGATFCIGPVVSALVNKFGCRIISIAGCSLVAIGFFLSAFASNVITLYFTIGILSGCGFGMVFLPSIVIITKYFTTRLALATGLAVSAAGIGSAVFAPLTEYLILTLGGWRYAMQVIAVILFVSGLFALSFTEHDYDDSSTESGDEDTEEGSVYVDKAKIVKFNDDKDDLCKVVEEKLVGEDNLENADKLCNGDALAKIQVSQSSLNSVTSNEKHNRIINNHLNRNVDKNLELDGRNEQDNEMLIPIKERELSRETDSDSDKASEKNDKSNDQLNNLTNLNSLNTKLANNSLATSLNTNLNNLNNLSRTHEIPRLSLDSSANYRLQHQLQHHHLLLKENQIKKANDLLDDERNGDLALINVNNLAAAAAASDNLIDQPNQMQYKSFNSLHPNFNLSISNAKKNCSNLNTIVLYSTSMTSINYCCGNEPCSKEVNNSKHNSICDSKLTNVITTPLHKESVSVEKKHNCLIAKKRHSSKDKTYFKLKRRSTLEKIVTVTKYIKILLSWNLLRDRIFLWFAISNFLTSLGYYVPYFYIKERCLILPGMSPKSSDCSYLLSIIGFSSTAGRILFGFISDFQQCNRIYIYAHCLTLCGLSTILTVFAINYSLLAIFSVVFGLSTGAFVSLTTVIIVDLLGPDRVSNAFGLLLLFQGIASLIGPPIVGLLYDYTSSYDAGFVLVGISIVISGSMLYFVPCLKKKDKDQFKN